MKRHAYDLPIKVLLYEEEGFHHAHALEFDRVGQGDSFEEALEDLDGAVTAQMDFAAAQNDPSLLILPAPQEYFDRWSEAHREELAGLNADPDCVAESHRTKATILRISTGQLRKSFRQGRLPGHVLECA